MITAIKEIRRKGCHKIAICDSSINNEVSIIEDTDKVDGIGGMLWDGTLVACETLRCMDLQDKVILELGCGAGLLGIYLGRKNVAARVVMTDQEIDLAQENYSIAASISPFTVDCSCVQLDWGEYVPTELKSCCYDIIVGCEITCLYKQQKLLGETIRALSSDNTVILLTFDGPPPPHQSSYESSFSELMTKMGYLSKCIGHYRVNWLANSDTQPPESHYSVLTNLLPTFPSVMPVDHSVIDSHSSASASSQYHLCAELSEHHVLAYFLPIATRTCSRCHGQFIPMFNTQHTNGCYPSLDGCIYHPGYFVCRSCSSPFAAYFR